MLYDEHGDDLSRIYFGPSISNIASKLVDFTTMATQAFWNVPAVKDGCTLSKFAECVPKPRSCKDIGLMHHNTIERDCIVKTVDWLMKNPTFGSKVWNQIDSDIKVRNQIDSDSDCS